MAVSEWDEKVSMKVEFFATLLFISRSITSVSLSYLTSSAKISFRQLCTLAWTYLRLMHWLEYGRHGNGNKTLSSESTESKSSLLIIIYTLNPLIILPSLARSTSSVDNAVLLTAICLACEWSTSEVASPAHKETEVSSPSLTDKVDQATPPFALGALFFLALRTHLSIDALILVPPMFMLIFSSPASRLRRPGPFKYAQKYDRPYSFLRQDFVEISLFHITMDGTCCVSFYFRASVIPLMRLSRYLFDFLIQKTNSLTLPSLTPNPGVWWYFFTEMFDHFRPFFLMVFSLHLLLYVAPICIKFQHDPLYSIFILIGILATLKPYPTLSDHGLFVGMWVVMSEVHPYLRHPLPTLLTLLHSSLLQPLFAHLWLTHGTGNANFYYASTLVGACAGGLGIVDSIWAGLRIAVEKGRVETKPWRKRRLSRNNNLEMCM
ncbi:GPI transamidase subunit PIG-U-domain-containing protein [Rhodocollybia butyracea]|uniref:GPI transamidase subunit PIG-U-domain-containing protein n=1 Tax=Rhodocollybia butyracea TaxID=206335 RepID=A0A9P5P5R5_9AGAR|nr:GPI transamidase subunit PIG-U-domain-containing protein [Rhodocollybia butyracea]